MSDRGKKKLWMGLGLLAIVGALALLIGGGLRENVVFFLTPSELQARGAEMYDRPLRLGGQVKPETVSWEPDARDLRFVLQDDSTEVTVHATGAPPAMFQEGIGVVVEGHYRRSGVFESDNLMVKHSNEYAPPEEGHPASETYETLDSREPSS
jgi:cytochrome c-type biogenesis protein CcmE